VRYVTCAELRSVYECVLGRATFRIILRQPTAEDQFAAKLLGPFIDEIHWSKVTPNSSSSPSSL
jgi:hypothetical protein